MSVANEQVQPDLLFPHLLQHIVLSEHGVGVMVLSIMVLLTPEQPLDLHLNVVISVVGATCLRA